MDARLGARGAEESTGECYRAFCKPQHRRFDCATSVGLPLCAFPKRQAPVLAPCWASRVLHVSSGMPRGLVPRLWAGSIASHLVTRQQLFMLLPQPFLSDCHLHAHDLLSQIQCVFYRGVFTLSRVLGVFPELGGRCKLPAFFRFIGQVPITLFPPATNSDTRTAKI